MKKLAESFFYVFLVAIGLAGIWLVRGQFATLQSSQLSSEAGDGVLATSSSDVRVKNSEAVAWSPVYGQSPVRYGDQVFVGQKSSAALTLPEFELDIESDSLITVVKKAEVAGIDIREGRASVTLSQNQAVGVTVGGQSLQFAGAGSKLALTHTLTDGQEALGVSLTEGSATVVLPNGEKVQSTQGQSFVATAKAGSALQINKFSLISLAPASGFLALPKKRLSFKWKGAGEGIEDLKLVIARDRSLTRVVKSIELETETVEVATPTEPGDYFWAVVGHTHGTPIAGETRKFTVLELRAPGVRTPSLKLERPGRWQIGVATESLPAVQAYRVQISADPVFSQTLFDESSPSPLATTVIETQANRIFVRARGEYPKLSTMGPWSNAVAVPLPVIALEKTQLKADFNFEPSGHWHARTTIAPLALVETYHVQLSTDDSFSRVSLDQKSKSPTLDLDLPNLTGRVFVRARGEYDANGNAAQWSAVASFEIPASPFAPSVSLSKSAKGFDLRWSSPETAFEVATASEDSFTRAQNVNVNDHDLPLPCATNVRFARVRAKRTYGESGGWSSTVLIPACLPKPKILSARVRAQVLKRFNSGSGRELQVSVDGAGEFEVQVSVSRDFKPNESFKATGPDIKSVVQTPDARFIRILPTADPKRYFVRASDAVALEEVPFAKLVTPKPVQPLSEEMILMRANSEGLVFRWSPVGGAEGYDLQLSRDKDFSKPVLTQTLKEASVSLSRAQVPNGTLFWRVRAFHTYSETAWSSPLAFKVLHAR